MSFASDLRVAVDRHAGPPDSKDAVSFQHAEAGGYICFIRGVGGTGKTPASALTAALKAWASISRSAQTKRRRTPRG